jgi:hypothetical protein
MTIIKPKVGLPLERQRATVVASTPIDNGWVVLCIRWQEFQPYVVWDSWISDGELVFGNGHYSHNIGDAVYKYSVRGGYVSVISNAITINEQEQ